MLIGDLPRIQKSDEVKLQFTPYGDSFESKFYYGEMDNKTSVLMVIDGIAPFDTTEENADKFVWQDGDWRARPDLVAGLDGIIIDPDRNDAMHFQTGSMRGIIAALDKCTDGLAVLLGARY